MITSVTIAMKLNKRHNNVLRDIRKILTANPALQTDDMFKKSVYRRSNNQDHVIYVLSKKALKLLLSTYRNLTGDNYKALGINNVNVIHSHSRFEISFMEMLEESLDELGIEGHRQYRVDKYYVDYYIPKYNLAIEYDEEHHNNGNNMVKDIMRQEYIGELTNCEFIRLDYKISDIRNVMKVLKFITQMKKKA